MVDGWIDIGSIIQEQQSEAGKDEDKQDSHAKHCEGWAEEERPMKTTRRNDSNRENTVKKARDMKVSRRNLSAVSNAVRG